MKSMFQIRLFVIVAVMSLFMAHRADAKSLEEAIKAIAENVSAYLDEKGQRQIMMGNFDGPGGATAGRAIRAKLEELLKEDGVSVLPLGSNWKIRGEFSFEPRDTFSIVLIKTELVDKSGKEISGFREKVKVERVTSLEDISRVLGLTVDLRDEQDGSADDGSGDSVADDSDTPDDSTAPAGEKVEGEPPAGEEQLVSTGKAVTKKVSTKVNNPTFAFADNVKSKIAAESSSPFRVEVLVRSGGTGSFVPLDVQDAGGFPFAPLKGGDEYRIRVYNDASHPVGVKLSIDGINSFALSQDPQFRELGTWFVAPKSAGLISGWYVHPGLLKAFVVTADGDELNLPPASDIGTITAQFFHAWREGDPIPRVERLAARRGQLRTTAGPDIARETRTTRSFFGKQLLAAVSIRYSNPDDLPPGE